MFHCNSQTGLKARVRTGDAALFLFLWLALSSSSFAADPPTAAEAAAPAANTVDFSARDREYIREAGTHGKFIKMLDSPNTLPEFELNNIATEVHGLAFYRMSDRQNKFFPKNMYESIEQKMINKFTTVKRFAVHECFQCKTTRVLLKDNQFSILRQLDSNDSLSKVGKEIGVDHFVLWDAYTDQEQAVINLRIVSADKSQVRWSRQFRSGEVGKELDREFYTSFWGLGATRVATDAAFETVVAAPMIATGFRVFSRSSVSNYVYYGYGVEFFSNMTEVTTVLATGININGRLAIEVDPLFRSIMPQYGNWLLYFTLGQAFLINNPALMAGAGLELKPTRKAYVDFGAVYFTPTTFEAFPASGYENTASFGGMGYEVTLGYRF